MNSTTIGIDLCGHEAEVLVSGIEWPEDDGWWEPGHGLRFDVEIDDLGSGLIQRASPEQLREIYAEARDIADDVLRGQSTYYVVGEHEACADLWPPED